MSSDSKSNPQKPETESSHPIAALRDSSITQLGPYHIQKKIGSGGMGDVYLAIDPALNRKVAIKTLRQELIGDANFLERFKREARAVASLSHPGIVQIYYIGQEKNLTYFAMEYVGEKTLKDLQIECGRVPVDEILDYGLQAASALNYAHKNNIIHRDIKPANLLITKDGVVKIVDFGLAKDLSFDMSLTMTGAIVGSPLYMSPEQNLGHPADHRSDIYTLGATLFHLMHGKPPYTRSTAYKLMKAHEHEPLDWPKESLEIADGKLAALINMMMAKDPDERYQNYEDLKYDLQELLKEETTGEAGKMLAAASAPIATPLPEPQQEPSGFDFADTELNTHIETEQQPVYAEPEAAYSYDEREYYSPRGSSFGKIPIIIIGIILFVASVAGATKIYLTFFASAPVIANSDRNQRSSLGDINSRNRNPRRKNNLDATDKTAFTERQKTKRQMMEKRIQEQKELDEQKKKDQAKKELTSNVAVAADDTEASKSNRVNLEELQLVFNTILIEHRYNDGQVLANRIKEQTQKKEVFEGLEFIFKQLGTFQDKLSKNVKLNGPIEFVTGSSKQHIQVHSVSKKDGFEYKVRGQNHTLSWQKIPAEVIYKTAYLALKNDTREFTIFLAVHRIKRPNKQEMDRIIPVAQMPIIEAAIRFLWMNQGPPKFADFVNDRIEQRSRTQQNTDRTKSTNRPLPPRPPFGGQRPNQRQPNKSGRRN